MKRRILFMWCGLAALAGCGEEPGVEVAGDGDETVASRSFEATSTSVYVAPRGRWRLWNHGEDFGTAWREHEFQAGSYTTASAPMGYGETYVRNIGSPGGPITAYFRKPFYVLNPTAVLGLRLDMMYDDGFVAYINGQEVQRAAMPAGTITRDTLSTGHEANNTYVAFDIGGARGALRAGWNTLAIELHQASSTSSDQVFDASLIATVTDSPPPPPGATAGFARRSTWRYWDRGGTPGASWAQPGFDVSGWASGAGALGYGESYLATTVAFGPSATNKYVTTYFRRDFDVTDPAAVTALRGEVMYDDGFVVYLNGTRIGSAAMPAGTPTPTTLSTGHEANNSYDAFDWSAQRGLLRPGTNTVAVEVHQQSASSSDLAFDLALTAQLAAPGGAGIGRASTWRFWDRGGDLGSAWRALGFDDGAWASGGGPLGYGESYLGTTVSFGPSATSKHMTTYFRKKFTVADPALVSSVRGELMYDDGAVIYLNGQELARAGMPAGPVSASTPALGHEAENRYLGFDSAAAQALLVAGDNVVAVELHQVDAGSSDLVFDLALTLTLESGATPQFSRYPWNPVIRPAGSASGSFAEAYYLAPGVMVDELNQLWMFYAIQNDFITHDHHHIVWVGTTDAGVTWGPSPPNDIHIPGSQPSVMWDQNGWHMWYTDDDEAGIRFATTTNVLAWNLSAGIVVPRGALGSWDEAEVSKASVLRDASGYRMWYSGKNAAGAWSIGYATASNQVSWTKHPTPVLSGARNPVVIKEGGRYQMWFNDGNPNVIGVFYATSTDGVTWTRNGMSLAGAVPWVPNGSAWDERVAAGGVTRYNGALQLYYAGNAGYEAGLATVP